MLRVVKYGDISSPNLTTGLLDSSEPSQGIKEGRNCQLRIPQSTVPASIALLASSSQHDSGPQRL